MTDSTAIIASYNAKVAEADKVRGPDYKAIAEAVASEFGIPYEDVKEVLLEHLVGMMRAG